MATLFPDNSTYKRTRRSALVLVVLLPLLSLALLGNRPRTARELYDDGKRAFEKQDYRTALHYLQRATRKNPAYRKAEYHLAMVYYETGEYRRAREHFRRVMQLSPKPDLPALTGLGRVEAALGNYSLAQHFFFDVRKKDPGNAANNFALAQLYLQLGKKDLARRYFEKVNRKSPSHVGALLGMAGVAAEQGHFDKAARYLDDARRIGPVDPAVHISRGELLLRRALESNEELERISRFEQARAAFATAMQIAPAQSEMLGSRLLFIDLYRKRLASALERARTLLASKSDDPGLNYLAGSLTVMAGGDPRVATGYFVKALDRRPDDSLIRFRLERHILKRRANFAPSGALRRKLARYHRGRARFYESRHRLDRRDWHLMRTLELHPGDRYALSRTMEIARRVGDQAGFVNRLSRLSRNRPDDFRLRYRLARALRIARRSLGYRAGLRLGRDGNARRTPLRVFFFDVRPRGEFPDYPDAGRLLPHALAAHLGHLGGRLAPVADQERRASLKAARRFQPRSPFIVLGSYYRPEVVPQVTAHDDGSDGKIRFIVGGTYAAVRGRLHVDLSVYDRRGGGLVTRFRLSAGGTDAIHDIAGTVASRLMAMTPLTGRVIRSGPLGVLLNIGSVDGLRAGQELALSRPNQGEGNREVKRQVCQVQELDRRFSRCVLKSGTYTDVNPGDYVRTAPKRKVAAR